MRRLAGLRDLLLVLSLALPLGLMAPPASAQEMAPGWELVRPHFLLSASGVSNADTKDVPGEFGSRSVSASLGIPLLGSRSVEEGKVSPSFVAGFRVGADGNLYRIANDGAFPGQPSELNLRMTGLRAGAEASIRVATGAWLRLEAGVLAFRKLAVWDGDQEVQSTSVNPAPYGIASVVFTFGSGSADLWGPDGGGRAR